MAVALLKIAAKGELPSKILFAIVAVPLIWSIAAPAPLLPTVFPEKVLFVIAVVPVA